MTNAFEWEELAFSIYISLEGHRASDWPKDPNWSGKLKIVAKGRTVAIILFDDKNQVFAVCHATEESAVQKVLDSGRYFVLRITNQQGRHAYIGIAFNERNDAFDFNVALSEFRNELEREQNASKFFAEHTTPVDLTLKEGEKIKIKLVRRRYFIEGILCNCFLIGTHIVQNTKKAECADPNAPKPLKSGGLLPPPDMRQPSQSPAATASPAPAAHAPSSDPFSTSSSDPFGWGSNQSSTSRYGTHLCIAFHSQA